MQRIADFFCQKFMGFYTHQNIRGFNADNQIVIAQVLYDFHFIQRAFHQAFCCDTMIFFHQFFFQRPAVYSYADRDIPFFCRIHYRLDFFFFADISRINPNLIRPVFHGCKSHFIIEMNVCHQWNVYLFFNFFNSFCRFQSRHGTADNLAACGLQF